MKKILLASAFLVSGLSVASAGGVDTVNKSGFYLGVNGGYGSGKTKVNLGTATSGNLKPKGGLYGLHAGYQHDFGRFVGGFEVNGMWTRMHSTYKFSETFNGRTLSDAKLKYKRDHVAGLALRLGAKVAPCWVAGVKLGYERAKYSLTGTSSTSAAFNFKKSMRHNGFAPGVYIEKLLNQRIMVGAEYSYAMYKKKNVVDPYFNQTITVKPHAHDFKVRLGYKF